MLKVMGKKVFTILSKNVLFILTCDMLHIYVVHFISDQENHWGNTPAHHHERISSHCPGPIHNEQVQALDKEERFC